MEIAENVIIFKIQEGAFAPSCPPLLTPMRLPATGNKYHHRYTRVYVIANSILMTFSSSA